MVDTDGRGLELLAHPADVQDRDGAVPLLKMSRSRRAFVGLAYADSAYVSSRVAMATLIGMEIVRKFSDQIGLVVHPRRWVVERTFACSTAIAASPKTSTGLYGPRPPSSMPPQRCCSSGAWLVTHKIRGGLSGRPTIEFFPTLKVLESTHTMRGRTVRLW